MTTIGVSVAVPEPWATQLQSYRESLGDDTAATIPTHITLLPPVDFDDSLLPEIIARLQDAAGEAEPFEVHLRGTGTFRPVSPVVFVGVVEGISGFEALAALVRRPPLDVSVEFPYHPHVTIAHHLSDDLLDRAFEEQSGFECRFLVEHFWLYTHDEDKGWIPTCDFPLGMAGALPGAVGG
ncbi:MAG: 2'-5' RNA ligase family protein [Nocardioidaceae bacterium]